VLFVDCPTHIDRAKMLKILKNILQLDGVHSIMQLKKIYEAFLQLS